MGNTEQQKLAITTIDKNIAVNAGAGTGKTKVLTERYIYILENGELEKNKEVESIVAITFTKKATQEMKERIREEIRNRFSLGSRWRRYYKDMEKANISTIHSFCANILRDNALEANIDPMFRVLDDSEGDLLLDETILNLVLQGIEEDENIYSMIRVFNSDNLDRIANEIKSTYYKIRSVGYSFQEIKEITLDFIHSTQLDLEEIQYIKNTFIYLMDKSSKNSKIYRLQNNDIWLKFYRDEYSREQLTTILEFLYDNIGTSSKESYTIENLKASISKVLLIEEKEYIWLYETLLELLIQIDEEYSRKKDEEGVLDYDDLQILVLNLLDNKSIREKYQNKFKYIMVDEFQDVNELQKKIFYKLCTKDKKLDGSNLFIVGDPKQSIYGFRGADLDVFYDVMEDIEEISKQKPIVLNKNFRTVNTILNFVNTIFDKLMGSRYSRLKEHHISKNKIDIEILKKEDLEIPVNIKDSDYHIYYESRLIASRIKELVYEKKFSYGDFALLFRSTTVDYIYEDALKEYGIPYYNIGGKRFYERQEIIDLINGLKTISNPYDTISVVGFLRGPMVGLSDKTLYWLLRYKKDNLLKTLDEDIPYIDKDEKEKAKKTKEILTKLMIKKDLYGASSLLGELVNTTYYLEVLLLKQGGKQSVANVYKLLEIARDFDKNFLGSLEDFIDYIERLKDTDESQAKMESEDADVVKIMTIHKSKGLQFPVVVIPQMSRGFNYQQPSVLFDKNWGIAIKHHGISALYANMKEDIRNKEDEENKRILYVAMTRAEKRLIIGNQGKNSGFKKMIRDLIDGEQTNTIGDIKISPDLKEPIKMIDKKLFKSKTFKNKVFPLIREMPGYNQRFFPSVNVSQYIEFKQCKRRFFMDYYKKLPFEYYMENRVGDSRESSIQRLNPATKGNIVHKFCEYYRRNMKPRNLMAKVVNSFGLEYGEEIEKELSPYIKNYLKNYKDDYDQIYTEKSFYLRIEDTYINGIIDRINIKKNKAEILDFKTNKVYNKNHLLDMYKPQLQLYADAFQRITNMEVERASILFLETGELAEIDISKESLDENYESIGKFVQFIVQNNSISQYEKWNNCKGNCKYSILCNIN